MKIKIDVGFSMLFLLVIPLAYSRSIGENLEMISDGLDTYQVKDPSFLQWRLSASTITCEPVYGFLPCSTSVWGLLFLIVVYEILLSFGGQFVANASSLFFQVIGPGIFGASMFQILSQIPQITLVLVSTISGTAAAAQQRATLGMGLVAGTTVMMLTLIWGLTVIFGSYDLSATDSSGNSKRWRLKSYGVVTDTETSHAARIMLLSLVPFLILVLAKFFNSSSGRRVVILIALLVTFILLAAYMIYQIFQPSIQNRLLEQLVSKYTRDKLMQLISSNGMPDTAKIQKLYNRIGKTDDASVSAAELRILLVGVKLDDGDKNTERDVEAIMASFDTTGDGRINQDEFVKGMTKLASDISKQTNSSQTINGITNSQSTNQGSSTTNQRAATPWSTIFQATFLLIFGTAMLCVLSEPMIESVIDFCQAADLSAFVMSYVAIPVAMNYAIALQSISSARQKTHRSISLTLSSLYNGVYMNNVIGLIVYLAPVYARNLSSDVSAEVLVVLIICIMMNMFACFWTTIPAWTGILVLLLYPISLAAVYVLTAVFGWS